MLVNTIKFIQILSQIKYKNILGENFLKKVLEKTKHNTFLIWKGSAMERKNARKLNQIAAHHHSSCLKHKTLAR